MGLGLERSAIKLHRSSSCSAEGILVVPCHCYFVEGFQVQAAVQFSAIGEAIKRRCGCH